MGGGYRPDAAWSNCDPLPTLVGERSGQPPTVRSTAPRTVSILPRRLSSRGSPHDTGRRNTRVGRRWGRDVALYRRGVPGGTRFAASQQDRRQPPTPLCPTHGLLSQWSPGRAGEPCWDRTSDPLERLVARRPTASVGFGRFPDSTGTATGAGSSPPSVVPERRRERDFAARTMAPVMGGQRRLKSVAGDAEIDHLRLGSRHSRLTASMRFGPLLTLDRGL